MHHDPRHIVYVVLILDLVTPSSSRIRKNKFQLHRCVDKYGAQLLTTHHTLQTQCTPILKSTVLYCTSNPIPGHAYLYPIIH